MLPATAQQVFGVRLAKLDAPIPAQNPAFSPVAQVILDESFVKQHIAIDDDQIVTGGGAESPVQNHGLSKALIFVDHMPYGSPGKFTLETRDHACHIIAGAIVGHDNLEASRCLMRGAVENQGKLTRLVVDGNDEGALHEPFSTASEVQGVQPRNGQEKSIR